ncbi:MAG: hypothetical protein ACRDE5_17140 [Ginsengibacter sp.]
MERNSCDSNLKRVRNICILLLPMQEFLLFSASPQQLFVRAAVWFPTNSENNYDAPIFCLSTKYYRNGINDFGMLKHFSE